MEKSIIKSIYMRQVLDSVKEQYKGLEIEGKKEFLERIKKRREEDFSCENCPEQNKGLVSLCNLCNIISYNFDSSRLNNEMDLLTKKNDR